MRRMAFVISINQDKIAEYRYLHEKVWPEILEKIKECNIRNYSIFLREPENLLFAVYDYVGVSFAEDMAKMAADPVTQRWWELTDPCQEKLTSASPDEWWAPMEEIFHLD